jgi:uncharacterized membrane protein YqhA
MERLGRLLALARYIILLGVIASLALSLVLFIVILGHSAIVITEAPAAITSIKALKLLIVDSIELADLALLAVALYITGVGLFELFIAPVHMPEWLTITSLDDLKSRLVNIVVVALSVSFFGQVVTWNGVTNLLPLGVAIGVVILALAAFGALRLGSHGEGVTTTNEREN